MHPCRGAIQPWPSRLRRATRLTQDSLRWHGQRADVALPCVPAEPGASWLTAPAFHRGELVGAWVLDGGLPPSVLKVLG